MTVLIVVLMFVGFVVLDIAVRTVTRRLEERRASASAKPHSTPRCGSISHTRRAV